LINLPFFNSSAMQKITVLVVCAWLIMAAGCTSATQTQTPDEEFTDLAGRLIENLWKTDPDQAVEAGNHAYDSLLTVPDEFFRQQYEYFAANYLDSLLVMDPQELSPGNRIDYFILKNRMEYILWRLNEYKSWQWNPAVFNVGGAIAAVLNGRYAPLEQRLMALAPKLERVPAYYQAARDAVRDPTRVHTELAIVQNRGTLQLLRQQLADSVRAADIDTATRHRLLQALAPAAEAVEQYISWLENDILPGLDEDGHSFRIGEELYEAKFSYEIQSRYTARQIYEKALRAKDSVHRVMQDLARQVWPKYIGPLPDSMGSAEIARLLDTLSTRHVPPDSFETAIRALMPRLAGFVREHHLLTLDSTKPLLVRQTPGWMLGPNIASLSAPGPFDTSGASYYNVNPMDIYTRGQQESWLREYNRWMMQILSIHEGIPGHYVQLVYSNKAKSLVKSLFGNTTMIEGWACYAERLLLENGYGNHSPEMMLMYNKWLLRIICNTILDYGVHVLDMSREEAMDLLVNQAFQEESEALGKWRRVSLTQVQLTSYFTGLTEILQLREEMKRKLGDEFSLQEFNEQFLSYGSAPVKYIRELMLSGGNE